MKSKKPALAALLLALSACSAEGSTVDRAVSTPTATSTPSSPASVRLLQDGILDPGRYRFDVPDLCESPDGCGVRPKPALPSLEVTVPTGWEAQQHFDALFPAPGRDTASPNDPALVMGWTNYWVRLFSNPCLKDDGPPPDIAVGPTVDDFVNAVHARPGLKVTKATPVTLGKHRGRFFTLKAPADISKCAQWKPWDPSPYAQGPANIWDLWVMDVHGVRVVIMAQYFPSTPASIKAELRAMAQSVRFSPRS